MRIKDAVAKNEAIICLKIMISKNLKYVYHLFGKLKGHVLRLV